VDNFFWLDRIQREYGAWSRATGGSVVEMHLYRPPAFFDQPEALILAQALRDLYRAFPEVHGHAVHQVLQRNAAVHTRLTVDRAERWLGVQTPWANLWACGDWVRGPWPALFIERACASGLAAANAVLRTAGREPFPQAAYDEPEWLAGRMHSTLDAGWARLAEGPQASLQARVDFEVIPAGRATQPADSPARLFLKAKVNTGEPQSVPLGPVLWHCARKSRSRLSGACQANLRSRLL
jgi:hypothetical protein